ncbi:MAG: peptidyl-prolyl cis-trans isomerase [Planctomycetales bacterium]|nr:peptidyl-prolyl cis-trans isomerase [Planctomycetales bacterium]
MNEALDHQRRVYMKQMLTGVIENKLLYQEFLRSLPADKLDEAMVKIRKNLSDEYDKSELPKAMERAKVSTAAELDAKLRKYGSSLAKQKQTLMERQLGRAAVGRSVNTQPEITHTEQLNYYNQHADKYAIPSKARWEQMTVLFDKFPSKQAAYEAMARMGNEVYLGGAPFAAVAKRSSQASNSEQGGYYDWTSQGSLRSESLDQAVFTLPLNQLSPILEDDRGFHIVRVLERTQASSVPFEEAQEEIKSELKQQKLKTAIESFLEQTRENVYIWTMFDEEENAVTTANNSPAPASY